MGLGLKTGLRPVLLAFARCGEGRVRCVSACPGDAGYASGDVQWRVMALSLLPDTGEGEMPSRSSKNRYAVDASATRADEGRGKLRKATVGRRQATRRRYPNGATRRGSC